MTPPPTTTTLDAPAAARAAPVCAHCAAPLAPPDIRPDRAEQFCCAGCETAASVIRSSSLARYYDLRDRARDTAQTASLPQPPSASASTGRRYTEMDDPTFTRLYVRDESPDRRSTEFYLEGVHCAACLWLVERLPQVLPGVIDSRLNMRRSLVRVTWDPRAVELSAVARALDSLGYPPHPARDGAVRDLRDREDRRFMIDLAVAGACATNGMLVAIALYTGVFSAMDPAYQTLFRWTSMAVTLVAVAWPGARFFRGALSALRTRTAHLDVPIALGIAAGTAWSALNTVRGSGEVWFDSISMLVFALLVGRFVQHRQQRWAAGAVELLFSLTSGVARLVVPGPPESIREVPVEALRPGDTLEVLAGHTIPADAVVLSGSSTIDQSFLTGESRPCPVNTQDRVPAGSVNLSARLLLRVELAGEHTRLGRLLALVQDAASRRAPIVRMADRLAGRFIAVVVAAAIVTFIAWLFIDPPRALPNALALLIVTCPCGLGLATPLAMTVAVGRAAKGQMLIKGADAIESLSAPSTLFLDKTGTITHASFEVVSDAIDPDLFSLIASAESVSTHPLARAITAHARRLGLPIDTPPDARETPSRGVVATVRSSRVAVGSRAFVTHHAPDPDPAFAEQHDRCVARAHTPVWAAVDSRVVAVLAMGDPVRADAAPAIRSLQNSGWRVSILSGDDPAVVRAVSREVGIDPSLAHGGLSPEDKLRRVEHARTLGPVVMVGDGVNDAAALAAATVGIAVHAGAEAAMAAADVYLARPGLAEVDRLISASRGTLDTIRANMRVSLVYNVAAAALCLSGLISPLLAAILMPVSSLTVLACSFRPRNFRLPASSGPVPSAPNTPRHAPISRPSSGPPSACSCACSTPTGATP